MTNCKHSRSRVLDTRFKPVSASYLNGIQAQYIYRRRKCCICNVVFSTAEIDLDHMLSMQKELKRLKQLLNKLQYAIKEFENEPDYS